MLTGWSSLIFRISPRPVVSLITGIRSDGRWHSDISCSAERWEQSFSCYSITGAPRFWMGVILCTIRTVDQCWGFDVVSNHGDACRKSLSILSRRAWSEVSWPSRSISSNRITPVGCIAKGPGSDVRQSESLRLINIHNCEHEPFVIFL